MLTNKGKLIARLLFVPVSGLFAFLLFAHFGKSLIQLMYALTKDDYELFLRFDTREEIVFWISAGWIASYAALEVTAHFSAQFKYKRLLTNFRYAPVAILLISGFVTIIYDAGMISYSKGQIRNYVFSGSQSIAEPDFLLYNNYRGWCGNGFSAWENYLYFDTASEGLKDADPYVRARSLLMAREVQDWLNGGDERFDNFLANACSDSDNVVKDAAENLLNKSQSSCRKYLLSR